MRVLYHGHWQVLHLAISIVLGATMIHWTLPTSMAVSLGFGWGRPRSKSGALAGEPHTLPAQRNFYTSQKATFASGLFMWADELISGTSPAPNPVPAIRYKGNGAAARLAQPWV